MEDPKSNDQPFEVRPLSSFLGAEIVGIDLQQAVSHSIFRAIYEAFLEHQLLLFDNIDLPPALQVEFAGKFGEVQVHVMNQYHGYEDHPEIFLLSNLDENGTPNGQHPDKGTLFWHTDGSWRDRTGLATMMYSEAVPNEGGETQFCDMYGAYERLDPEIKSRLEGRNAIHNLDFTRKRHMKHDTLTSEQKASVPPVAHPVFRTHPETGRKSLFLGDHAESIEGMDYEEGRKLIDELNELSTPDEWTYSHRWKPGQVLIWDNRCLLHRGTPFDTARERRVMRRCTTMPLET